MMRRSVRTAIPLIVLAAIASSCSSAPSRLYVQISDAHVAVTEEVTALSRAEVLTVKQVEVAFELLTLADARLDEYRNGLALGRDWEPLEALLKTVAGLLQRVGRIIAERGGS